MVFILKFELNRPLEDYTEFILDAKHKEIWETLIDLEEPEMKDRLKKVRRESAHCVWYMEKYRAMTVINSNDMPADYFKNVEGCIEEEFGNFTINRDSRVLLIGVGVFPMTPLVIQKIKILGESLLIEALNIMKGRIKI